MTPQQAVDLVDKAVQLVDGKRQDHINLQIAVETLRSVVNEHAELTAPKSKQNDDNTEVIEEAEVKDAKAS